MVRPELDAARRRHSGARCARNGGTPGRRRSRLTSWDNPSMADDSATQIEMIVDSVRVHMRTGRHVLVLRESGRGRLLMVWVGVNEANAIAMKLQGVTPERPLTHDLIVNMVEAIAVRVDRIVISDLADETFHARLVLVGPDSRHDIDARPS